MSASPQPRSARHCLTASAGRILLLAPAGAALIAALAWLVSRLWMGISFTDEMLYYGHISGLVRTGRLFQDDLAVQQLTYLFVHPLFKLHALVFPDQSYLILYGRVCLLAAYLAVGWVFWRAAGRIGEFTTAEKLTGLAAYFAWIPFQIFAFSYNTSSYLLTVLLLAVWLTRDRARPRRSVWATAVLLTVFTYTYPTVGLALIPLAALEALRGLGPRAALEMLGATAFLGCSILGLIAKLQGADLIGDVQAAVKYTRGFSVARTILHAEHLRSFVLLVATFAAFLFRVRLGRPFAYPLGPKSPPTLRWTALAAFVIAGAALLGLTINWKWHFAPASAFMGLLVVAGASVGPDSPAPAKLRFADAALFRLALLLAVAGGGVALLAIGVGWTTGYFATTVVVLLLLLAAAGRNNTGGFTVVLAVSAAVQGGIVACTSSNGVHNFGIGAAGAIPFLMMTGMRALAAGVSSHGRIASLALPAIACLILWNGMRNPYTEQPFGRDFHRIEGVPAFRGIWTSPEKIQAIGHFQALVAPVNLRNRRVLVVGPHPWIYFVTQGQPATPMFWMAFFGAPESYEVVAERLFRGGPPDAIILTENVLPPPISAKVMEWMQEPFAITRVKLPVDFIRRFHLTLGTQFIPEVYLVSRPPAPPAPAAAQAR